MSIYPSINELQESEQRAQEAEEEQNRAEQMLSSAHAELRALQSAANDTGGGGGGGGNGGGGDAAGRDSAASREAADDQVTEAWFSGLKECWVLPFLLLRLRFRISPLLFCEHLTAVHMQYFTVWRNAGYGLQRVCHLQRRLHLSRIM